MAPMMVLPDEVLTYLSEYLPYNSILFFRFTCLRFAHITLPHRRLEDAAKDIYYCTERGRCAPYMDRYLDLAVYLCSEYDPQIARPFSAVRDHRMVTILFSSRWVLTTCIAHWPNVTELLIRKRPRYGDCPMPDAVEKTIAWLHDDSYAHVTIIDIVQRGSERPSWMILAFAAKHGNAGYFRREWNGSPDHVPTYVRLASQWKHISILNIISKVLPYRMIIKEYQQVHGFSMLEIINWEP